MASSLENVFLYDTDSAVWVWLLCCKNTDDRLCPLLLAIANIIVSELNLHEIAVQFVSANYEKMHFGVYYFIYLTSFYLCTHKEKLI